MDGTVNNNELARCAVRYMRAERRRKAAEKKAEEVKAESIGEIERILNNNGGKGSFLFSDNETINKVVYRATLVERNTIKWDIEKLKQRLCKREQKMVLVKKYEITDYCGLVEFLKQYGVDPVGFKRFISVSEVVDSDRIDQLYSVGKLGYEDLRDACTVSSGKKYLRITEVGDRFETCV